MDFRELDLTEMDANLSEEQQKEWNAIYASYRSKSVLTGRVVGIDSHSITLTDKKTGERVRKSVLNLVIIGYRVKVIIPQQEAWFNQDSERPEHVFRSMVGSVIDYVITGIDRENECCTASRRDALIMRRKTFAKSNIKIGRKISVNILAVGSAHLLATYGGYDMTLSQRDLSYGMINDLKEKYRPGQTYTAVYKGFDEEKNTLNISIKEAKPHPFDGVEIRHPLNSRRVSKISGKYKGGVFCKIEEELDCLCIYSQYECDEDYDIGDHVIVVITKYDYSRKLVYGKVVAKL